ncbi:MAG: hypothetical protein ACR2ME_00550 [Acidimicrobiia bacterium]
MGAAADCEAIAGGFFGQPANAVSTIAFLVAGLWLVWQRPRARWVGIGLVAAGVGSFLFHGPMPTGNEWAHDVSLAWLLALIAGHGTRWKNALRIPALLVLAAVIAFAPMAADPIAVALSVVAVGSILWRERSWATVGPLLLAGAAGLYGRLGATGGPLCDPTSIWQPHAVWHIAAATCVVWLETTSFPAHL